MFCYTVGVGGGSLMVSISLTLEHDWSKWSGLMSLGCGYCVVFMEKTLYSHSASLHPGVNGFNKFNAGG